MLTLLDLSTAFDSVDRDIFLCRLQTFYNGRVEIVIACHCLTGRTQCVRS